MLLHGRGRIAGVCLHLSVILPLLHAASLGAQVRSEIIVGHVVLPDGRPAAGALAQATRAPDRKVFRASADLSGRYEIRIDSGSGDYLLHISLPTNPSLSAYRRRLLRSAGSSDTIVHDVRLSAGATNVSAVRVEARRPLPPRGPDAIGNETGSASQQAVGLAAAIAPELRGDLAAFAAALPGVLPTNTGVSVFGLASSQNATMLNGMAFPGTALPRDVRTEVRVSTAVYDPSRGWFGGAETSVELAAARLFSESSGSITINAPAVQSGDPATGSRLARFTDLTLSTGGSGLTLRDRVSYNFGVQYSQSVRHAAALEDLDAAALELSGLPRDSALGVLRQLQALQLPGGVTSARLVRTASVITRINSIENDPQTLAPRPSSVGLIVHAATQDSRGLPSSLLSTRTTAADGVRGVFALQGVYSRYIGTGYLAEAKTSLSAVDEVLEPAFALPHGFIQLDPDVLGVGTPAAAIRFGGSPASLVRRRQYTWESRGELKYLSASTQRHRYRLTADVRWDVQERQDRSNEFGTFYYATLADFHAGTPRVFSRALQETRGSVSTWNGFLAASHQLRPAASVQVQYGVRLEGTWLASDLGPSAAVKSALSQNGPSSKLLLHASPRVGFSWAYGGRAPATAIVTTPNVHFAFPSMGVIKGGIGEFREMLGPTSAVGAVGGGTLGDAESVLTCVGENIPLADWGSYSVSPGTIPTSCAPGHTAPAVPTGAVASRFLDAAFRPATNWRASLSWSAGTSRIVWIVEGVLNEGYSQPSLLNLNQKAEPIFRTALEDRPVFVSAQSIAAQFGTVNASAARAVPSLGPVIQVRSDGRSSSRQLIVTLMPNFARMRLPLYGSLSYTLASARQRLRGYDATTFAAPNTLEWARARLMARHGVVAQLGWNGRVVGVGVAANLRSGRPFTPIVGSDVNADGLKNDRAFIFVPEQLDAQAASRMRALSQSGPANVRKCLRSQSGAVAVANSCFESWTTDLNARLTLAGQFLSGWRRRVTASLVFSNLAAGADALLHGRHLAGWGSGRTPDPVLLSAVGFDSSARRFRYAVNSQFGRQSAGVALGNPGFRVALDVRLDLGVHASRQQLARFVRPGRDGRPGPRLTATELQQRFARNVPEPYALILAESDSLLLSSTQVRALQTRQVLFRAQMDSAWRQLANSLTEMPDSFNERVAFQLQERVIDAVWNLGRVELRSFLPTVLNSQQLLMLPSFAGLMYRAARPLRGLRYFAIGRP